MPAEVKRTLLEQRISKLENAKKVAMGLAAALGISGAVLLNKLSEARSQVGELETKVSELTAMVDASIGKIKAATESGVHRVGATSGALSQVAHIREDTVAPANMSTAAFQQGGGNDASSRGSTASTGLSRLDMEVAETAMKKSA